jgi:Subtilase family
MTPERGFTWDKARRLNASRLVVLTIVLMLLASLTAGSALAGPRMSVIVRTEAGARDATFATVRSLGGRITLHLDIISGFAATVPRSAIPVLARAPGVLSVSPNAQVRLMAQVDGYDPNWSTPVGSWKRNIEAIKAKEVWKAGYLGQGIDVALIDSGVAPVKGIKDHLLYGPDLSFESQTSNLSNVDSFGHGTHMAGIIAGRDSTIQAGHEDEDLDKAFVGVAPKARIVSVKVATSSGATDVSQVIAAIDWVVQHRNADGLNIRVLNLSFGTDGTQDYTLDPLAYAAEVAWMHGIVVVVAAGNAGFGTPQLNNPAYDPYVIAVGADDTRGSDDPKDDVIPDWQSRGNALRHPDIVAPGKSIVSLRDPGAFVDEANPGARVGYSRFFRGSGSSQAAAIVSGAVATLLDQRPQLTPDQVKALLMQTAVPLPNADPVAQGAGLINLHRAREAKTETVANAVQTWPRSSGLGSLQLARGSVTAEDEGVLLQGEQTIFGDTWDATTWASQAWDGTSWSGGSWSGRTWSGDCWCGQSWSGRTWSGRTWSGSSWSGRTWSGRTWSGRTWSAGGWTAGTWDSADAPTSLSGAAWSSTLWGD